MSWPSLPWGGRPYRPWWSISRMVIGGIWTLLGALELSRHHGWFAYVLLVGGLIYVAYGVFEHVRYARSRRAE